MTLPDNVAVSAKETQKPAVKMRKAMTMIELVIVLSIVLIGLSVVLWMWGGMQTKLNTSAFNNKITTVISGIEKAKNDYNKGAYVANGTAPIPTIQKLNIAMGGTRATSSLGGWTYGCPAGNTSTITVQTDNINDPDERTGVVLYVNDKYTDWTAAVSGSRITLTRPNSVCN